METRSKAETEKFYREVVAEQEKSGLTIRAFAEKRGIPAGTLSYWRHYLKKRDAAPARGSEKASKPAFVPVSVVSPNAATAAAPKPKPSPSTNAPGARTVYEVVLGRDRVLRLPADFDETRVAALVRAVASC